MLTLSRSFDTGPGTRLAVYRNSNQGASPAFAVRSEARDEGGAWGAVLELKLSAVQARTLADHLSDSI